MKSVHTFGVRVVPALLAIGGLAILAAACSSSSKPSASPTIPYITPTPGTASPSPTTAPPGSPTASASPSASSTATANAPSTTIDLTAKDIAFNLKTITVPAGQKITVKFTNEDSIPHNFSVLDKKGGTALFTGAIFTGPNVTKTETFTAPSTPGNYYFQCDVHPAQMNGTLVVK